MTYEGNIFFGPIDIARRALAASATFQTLVEAEDAAAALASIHSPGLIGPAAEVARPCAWVDVGDELALERRGYDHWADNGAVDVVLEVDVPAAHAGETAAKWAAAHQWFLTLASAILTEFAAAGHGAVPNWFSTLRVWLPPGRGAVEDRQDMGDYYRVGFTATREVL